MDALGVHPARFFRQAFPFTADDVSWYLDPPHGTPPPIVARAQERLNSTRSASIPRSHLVELDALRYDHPGDAGQGALEAVPYIEPANVPFALGVWASSQNQLFEFDNALHALRAGLKIAEDRQDHGTFGSLLQRVAAVTGDHGNYGHALVLEKEATDRYLLAGDTAGIGRSFVGRGLWLYYLEQYRESIAMQERALDTLPDFERANRCAAFQVLGLCYQALGELERAQDFSLKARAEVSGLGVFLTGKQTWLQAAIRFEQGAFDEAETLLKDVVEVFADIHAGDAALATIDLAEVQLLSGKPAAAYLSAQAILPLITPLGAKNRIVRSAEHALRELAQQGAQAMSEGLITQLRTLVKSIRRERHLWRSLLRIN